MILNKEAFTTSQETLEQLISMRPTKMRPQTLDIPKLPCGDSLGFERELGVVILHGIHQGAMKPL